MQKRFVKNEKQHQNWRLENIKDLLKLKKNQNKTKTKGNMLSNKSSVVIFG